MGTFMNLKDTNWTLAQVYLYTFLCLFIYVVLKVFITIIEDAYFLNTGSPPHGAGGQHAGLEVDLPGEANKSSPALSSDRDLPGQPIDFDVAAARRQLAEIKAAIHSLESALEDQTDA